MSKLTIVFDVGYELCMARSLVALLCFAVCPNWSRGIDCVEVARQSESGRDTLGKLDS